MLIVCPQCATSYQVELPTLGPSGRSVRCTRCRNVWFAAAPMVVPAFSTAGDFDLVDNGPKVPSLDSPRGAANLKTERLPPGAAPSIDAFKAEQAPLAAEPPDVADRFEEAAPARAPDAAGEAAEPASLEGIDLAGLRQDLEAEQAQQEAAADAVLAEVAAQEIAAADAPSLVPGVEPVDAAAVKAAPTADTEDAIENFVALRQRRRAKRRSRQWTAPGLPTLILALAAANTMLVAWRADIVRFLPQTAPLYAAIGLPVNLRGLVIEGIKVTNEAQEGMTVLVVEGSIANITRHPVEVPRIRLALRNAAKNEIYSWTTLPARSILNPGETMPLQARLASPPAEMRDVLVRFFTKQDIVAGLH